MSDDVGGSVIRVINTRMYAGYTICRSARNVATLCRCLDAFKIRSVIITRCCVCCHVVAPVHHIHVVQIFARLINENMCSCDDNYYYSTFVAGPPPNDNGTTLPKRRVAFPFAHPHPSISTSSKKGKCPLFFRPCALFITARPFARMHPICVRFAERDICRFYPHTPDFANVRVYSL